MSLWGGAKRKAKEREAAARAKAIGEVNYARKLGAAAVELSFSVSAIGDENPWAGLFKDRVADIGDLSQAVSALESHLSEALSAEQAVGDLVSSASPYMAEGLSTAPEDGPEDALTSSAQAMHMVSTYTAAGPILPEQPIGTVMAVDYPDGTVGIEVNLGQHARPTEPVSSAPVQPARGPRAIQLKGELP